MQDSVFSHKAQNVFKTYGIATPSNGKQSYQEFVATMTNRIAGDDDDDDDDDDDERDEKPLKVKVEEKLDKLHDLEAMNRSTKRRIVHCRIDYPLHKPTCIKWVLEQEATFGMLLWLHAKSYNIVYQIEEQTSGGDPGNIEGMFNRNTSEGMFGIWGHRIGDLLYNGHSIVGFLDDSVVVCDFHVDS